jgi:hypothetical protein
MSRTWKDSKYKPNVAPFKQKPADSVAEFWRQQAKQREADLNASQSVNRQLRDKNNELSRKLRRMSQWLFWIGSIAGGWSAILLIYALVELWGR